jgi:hypothetical protein
VGFAMITIDSKAVAYIERKKQSIYLDIPPIINNCCFSLRESPNVCFGRPHNQGEYTERNIQGITVFIPYDLPEIPLTITASNFFGFTRLAVEGWCLA